MNDTDQPAVNAGARTGSEYISSLTTLSQLAAQLGLTENSLKRKCRTGDIGCIRLSRSEWRFTDQQITDYLNRHTNAGPVPDPALVSQTPQVGMVRPAMSSQARAALARGW